MKRENILFGIRKIFWVLCVCLYISLALSSIMNISKIMSNVTQCQNTTRGAVVSRTSYPFPISLTSLTRPVISYSVNGENYTIVSDIDIAASDESKITIKYNDKAPEKAYVEKSIPYQFVWSVILLFIAFILRKVAHLLW